MFIFVLQGVWLYIAELAGKDLDITVTARFILYYIPKLIPLVVPLTILLSSIMVFGNFAENYEFAAMKSTGISLQRAMRSLSVFIVILGVACFFFANNVIPWGEYEFYNLRRNIAKVKPALAIAEDQFTEIGNINIKVDKKTGENGKNLEDVIIHQKNPARTGNYKVIKSAKGELISDESSSVLQLKLIDGNYYEEVIGKNIRKKTEKPHVKSYFDNYIINVDLEILDNEDLSKKDYSGRAKMYNISELNYTIDSLNLKKENDKEALAVTLYNRTTYSALNNNIDTTLNSYKEGRYKDDILDLFDLNNKIQVLNMAVSSAKSSKQVLKSNQESLVVKQIWINKHIIALHDKYVLAVACIILFFVGAPLGALIRKGGLGLPIVIAVLLFLSYHFLGIFAKNSAEKGSFSPIIGSWLSTAIMLPLSIYLTYRATNDKGAFDIDNILKPLKELFGLKKKETLERQLLNEASEDYKLLNSFENSRLIKIINNYRDFDYKNEHKNSAIAILYDRGITEQELRLAGHISNQNHDDISTLKNEYEEDSNLTLILYSIMLVFNLLAAIFNNNYLPELAGLCLLIGIICFILFNISLIRSIDKYSALSVALGKSKNTNGAILYVLLYVLGLPLYILFYIFQRLELDLGLFGIKSKTQNKVQSHSIKISPKSQNLLKDYRDYSKTSLVSYSLGTLLLLAFFIMRNNKLPEAAEIAFNLSIVSFIFYSIYFVVDAIFFSKFHTSIAKPISTKRLMFMFLCLPIYPLRYLILNKCIRNNIKGSELE